MRRRKRADEGGLRTKVKEYLSELGLVSIKHTAMFSAGQPDCEIYFPGGRPGLLELKALGKKPTPLQYKRIKELQDLGYWVNWTDNFEEAKETIDVWAMLAKMKIKASKAVK